MTTIAIAAGLMILATIGTIGMIIKMGIEDWMEERREWKKRMRKEMGGK